MTTKRIRFNEKEYNPAHYRFRVETYNGFSMRGATRHGIQIVAERLHTPSGRWVRYCFFYKSPCYKMAEWWWHIGRGLSKQDNVQYRKVLAEAKSIVDTFNALLPSTTKPPKEKDLVRMTGKD